jgi:hypothetical protein
MLNRGLPTSANFSVDFSNIKIRPVALRPKAQFKLDIRVPTQNFRGRAQFKTIKIALART